MNFQTIPRPRDYVHADLPPGELARSITGRDYVSWSQIDQMRRCPRKFAFQYIDQHTPAFLPTSLLFGSAMHAAIELHFRRRLEGLPPDRAKMLQAYQRTWAERAGADAQVPIRFNQGEDEQSLRELAERMIDAFLVSPLAEPAGEVIAVEESVRARLVEGLPEVLARVDVIWQDRQAIHLVDFKTSRSRWQPDKAQQSAEQLLLYHHMIGRLSRELDQPIQLHFGIITKAKKPATQLLDVPGDDRRIEAILATATQIWQAVQAGHFYANSSPMNCTTCPFKSSCPAFGG